MTSLSVQLGNAFGPILAGRKLQGSIVLVVSAVLSGREIEATLTGEEKTTVEYESGAGDKKEKHTAYQTRCFLNIPIPLNYQLIVNITNGKINPGNYRVPFEVELPNSMPTSMKEAIGIGKCEIIYYITTRILGSGIIYNYHAKADFEVVARPLSVDPIPFNGEPVAEQVNVCCCFNRGHAVIGARLEDTVLGKSEHIKVYMAARNNSTVRIRRVYAELKECVQWEAGNHSTQTTRSLSLVEFPIFPGLEQKMPYEISRHSQVDRADIHREVLRGINSGVLLVPETAKDTFKGRLIECRHTLRVCLDTRCCVTHPTVEIPVQIGRKTTSSWTSTPAKPEFGAATAEPTIFIPESTFVSGSSAYEVKDDIFPYLGKQEMTSLPSVETLLMDMKNSINDLEDVKLKLKDDKWKPIFSSLSPAQFGAVIRNVDLDFDQPRVAELVAPLIKNGKFTCDYCVEAVRNASDWSRSTMVERLVSYCVDFETGKETIVAELDEWERTVTARVFETQLGRHLS